VALLHHHNELMNDVTKASIMVRIFKNRMRCR
jgi:hypothetical protein